MANLEKVSNYYYLTEEISEQGWLNIQPELKVEITNEQVRTPPLSGKFRLIPATFIHEELINKFTFQTIISSVFEDQQTFKFSIEFPIKPLFKDFVSLEDNLKLFFLAGGKNAIPFEKYLIVIPTGQCIPQMKLDGFEIKFAQLLFKCLHRAWFGERSESGIHEELIIREEKWEFKLRICFINDRQFPQVNIPPSLSD